MTEQAKPATFTFDEKAFLAALEKQRAFLEPFAGKKGYNPYFEIEKLKALRKRFDDKERTAELYQAALSLKQVEPKVTTVEPEPKSDKPVPTSVGPKEVK